MNADSYRFVKSEKPAREATSLKPNEVECLSAAAKDKPEFADYALILPRFVQVYVKASLGNDWLGGRDSTPDRQIQSLSRAADTKGDQQLNSAISTQVEQNPQPGSPLLLGSGGAGKTTIRDLNRIREVQNDPKPPKLDSSSRRTFGQRTPTAHRRSQISRYHAAAT
jgi:hypothetical protein